MKIHSKVLLIDNFDSFTYNLYQHFCTLGARCQVVRNDAIQLEEIQKLNPDRIVISPGPGNPDSAGISLALIRQFSSRIPILGVCLGHQAIAQAFGGRVVGAPYLMHGKISVVQHEGKGIFVGMPEPFQAVRYHSLHVERNTLPDSLEVTAETDDGLVMALKHREYPLVGVQFHPESIMTEGGQILISNFLKGNL